MSRYSDLFWNTRNVFQAFCSGEQNTRNKPEFSAENKNGVALAKVLREGKVFCGAEKTRYC